MKNTFYTFLLSGLVLTSCDNSTSSSAEKTKDSEQLPNKNPILDLLETEEDTIQYDTYTFPDDSSYLGKLLPVGDFHGDEVWPDAASENWFGLFKNGNDYYVSNTKIKLTKVYDAILDEDSINISGCTVEALNKDTAMYLFSGLNFLQYRKTQHLNFGKREIYPGDTVSFTFLGHAYKLFATGGKIKTSDDPLWYEVWNYKLNLVSAKNGKQINELLVAQGQFNDAMISILFAGDIDGDGLLDLIIDTSSHYNAYTPTLYLSKPASAGQLLKVVGRHVSVGC